MKDGYWYKVAIWCLLLFVAASMVRIKINHQEFRETLERIEQAIYEDRQE